MNPPVKVYIIADHPGAQVPIKAHPTDAGWDLFVSRDVDIEFGEIQDIHTDICVALPDGWFANIKTRSSTLVRHGLEVIDAVIDQGYRGELYIQVRKVSMGMTQVKTGDRIAQLLILPVPNVEWQIVDRLPASLRGTTGFGQSGR